MIIKKKYRTRADGVKLMLIKSDKGLPIRKVGTEHIDTQFIDVEGAPFEYEETESVTQD